MRSIIILAIGIYLGRQIYLQHDLRSEGLSKEDLQERWQMTLRNMGYSPLERQRIINRLIKYTSHAAY